MLVKHATTVSHDEGRLCDAVCCGRGHLRPDSQDALDMSVCRRAKHSSAAQIQKFRIAFVSNCACTAVLHREKAFNALSVILSGIKT